MILAVTTRNKLRSPRFFLPMVRAWWHIRRQLYATPGLVRYATGIASLTEFYTLTIWQSRSAMFDFVTAGSHRQMMWMFTRWSASFWSMRWTPTAAEVGAWDNLRLAEHGAVDEPGAMPAEYEWLARSRVAEALAPFIDTAGRPDRRNPDPRPSGVSAILARVATRSPVEVGRLRREVRRWQPMPGLVRSAVGIGPGECLLVTLWRNESGQASTELMRGLVERFERAWAMRLGAGDYEIGHWDGLRARQLAGTGQRAPIA